jgi:NAD(P)H-hydrate repair Nnr-like enzyme with NAD(P)H-hydrate epimerase domain
MFGLGVDKAAVVVDACSAPASVERSAVIRSAVEVIGARAARVPVVAVDTPTGRPVQQRAVRSGRVGRPSSFHRPRAGR